MAQPAPPASDTNHFLDLPAELRLLICEELLASSKPNPDERLSIKADILPLLLTNHQFRTEKLPVFNRTLLWWALDMVIESSNLYFELHRMNKGVEPGPPELKAKMERRDHLGDLFLKGSSLTEAEIERSSSWTGRAGWSGGHTERRRRDQRSRRPGSNSANINFGGRAWELPDLRLFRGPDTKAAGESIGGILARASIEKASGH